MDRRDGTSPPESLVDDDPQDLYDHAPCGYLSTLPDGTIVQVNQTFLDLTGYAREDLVSRVRFQDLLTPGGRIYHETHFAPLLRMQGHLREIALDLVCAGGRRMPVLVNAVMKTDEAGMPRVVRSTVFEATDRREYERELLRARERATESEARARLLAQTLQRSFIPPAPPEIPGLDVAAAYRPAGQGDEVGGDFYDVFETARGDWAVVLGDVCGKGAEAAGVTAVARYTVRAAAIRARRPSSVLATLNKALLRQQADRFCTAVYCRVRRREPGAVRLTVASGGHPLPLLVRPGHPVAPVGRPGDLLGILDEVTLHDVTLEMTPGEALVLFTDGVTEGRATDGVMFGEGRVRDVLATVAGASAAETTGRLLDEVLDFQSGLPRDDIAIAVLKVPG